MKKTDIISILSIATSIATGSGGPGGIGQLPAGQTVSGHRMLCRWGNVKIPLDFPTRQKSQDEYNRKYNSLVIRYEKTVDKLNSITAERSKRADREWDLQSFIFALQIQPLVLGEWSEELWLTLLYTAAAHKDGRITFLFKNGASVDVRG